MFGLRRGLRIRQQTLSREQHSAICNGMGEDQTAVTFSYSGVRRFLLHNRKAVGGWWLVVGGQRLGFVLSRMLPYGHQIVLRLGRVT